MNLEGEAAQADARLVKLKAEMEAKRAARRAAEAQEDEIDSSDEERGFDEEVAATSSFYSYFSKGTRGNLSLSLTARVLWPRPITGLHGASGGPRGDGASDITRQSIERR